MAVEYRENTARDDGLRPDDGPRVDAGPKGDEGLRRDDTGFGGLTLWQDPRAFCYGVDAVILADYAARGIAGRKDAFERAADLGCGTGIIPLILSHKTDLQSILAFEIQKESFDLTARNVSENGLQGRIMPLNMDVGRIPELAKDFKGQLDLVVSNPPYMARGKGIINDRSAKTTARHETSADIWDFARSAAFLLREKGEFYLVHRPSRLLDIFQALRDSGLEPKEVRMVCPDKWKAPNIVLVKAVKGGGPELRFLENLYVYDEGTDKSYSEEIESIYERR